MLSPILPARRRVALMLAALIAPMAASADEVVVFAAASMKTALDEAAEQFQQETGHRVTISYAGSSTLAKQIIEGAPADIFLSASAQWMDAVEKAGQIAPGTRRDLLGNSLVLISATPPATAPAKLGADLDLAGMLGDGRLAMAMVDSVPAGQYGKQALTSLGLWGAVAGQVAQTDNVRAALALVSTGEAPFGIVYATDAAADPAVHLAGAFPPDSHDAIVYPAALTLQAEEAGDTAFLDWLSGPVADLIFGRWGFAVAD